MRAIWDALYAADADVVVNGRDHDYERFAPQSPGGAYDPQRGIRQFVVGTGGAHHAPFGATKPNSQVRNNDTYGVLKLTLRPASYGTGIGPGLRRRAKTFFLHTLPFCPTGR